MMRLLIAVQWHMVSGWFYMTFALSFVKGDMFICVISNKDMYKVDLSLHVIGPIKHMDVWIKYPVNVLITD